MNLSESLRGKRGMRVHFALTLFVLALSGCGHGLDEAVASLDKGVSGYEGQVTPLSRPYLLRLEEGPDPPYRYTKISDLSGSTERTSMVLRKKILANGEQRRVWTKIEEISAGSRTFNADGAPIIIADAITSSRGRVERINLAFPAMHLAGLKIPEQTSEEYQQILSIFRSLDFEWPEAPVEMNSEILSPTHIEEMFDRADKEDGTKEIGNPRKAILQNTISVKIVGETYDDGVHCLLGIYSGTVKTEMKLSLFTMKPRGHVLIDSEHGTLRRFAYVVEAVSKRASGRYESTSYFELKPEPPDPGAL